MVEGTADITGEDRRRAFELIMNFSDFAKNLTDREKDFLNLLEEKSRSFSKKEKLIYLKYISRESLSANQIEILRKAIF